MQTRNPSKLAEIISACVGEPLVKSDDLCFLTILQLQFPRKSDDAFPKVDA